MHLKKNIEEEEMEVHSDNLSQFKGQLTIFQPQFTVFIRKIHDNFLAEMTQSKWRFISVKFNLIETGEIIHHINIVRWGQIPKHLLVVCSVSESNSERFESRLIWQTQEWSENYTVNNVVSCIKKLLMNSPLLKVKGQYLWILQHGECSLTTA